LIKTKLAVFMLDSYEMRYVQNKEKIPSPWSIGEVYECTVPFGLPVPSAKGYYWFYTGDGRKEKLDTLCSWPQYRAALREKDICFWNKTDKTFGIFGFPLEKYVISENVKFFQSITPLTVTIKPGDFGEKYSKEIKDTHSWVNRNLNDLNVATNFINKNHELYKKVLEEYDDTIDVMLYYYNTDWFSHSLNGPQLLNKISWVDAMVGETLDMLKPENVIMFSEHGANHSNNIIFSSTYGFKPDSYKEIIDFIHVKARNI